MALNDVLNRPLFRQQALKKGVLKPITAQTGIMVGQPISGSQPINPRTPVPAIRPNIPKDRDWETVSTHLFSKLVV